MNNTTIHQLIERYFAGESTLQEEQQLRAYFQRADIDSDLKQYQPLFQFFRTEQAEKTSQQFTQQLEQAPKTRIRHIAWRWAAVAATVVLLFVAGGYWLNQQDGSTAQTASTIDWSQYEPKTEAEALLITKKALSRTSSVINKSLVSAGDELDNLQQVLQPFK
ncbi:MAG: hypothetical protein AAGJ93_10200 [Bacteroidota bacterium]